MAIVDILLLVCTSTGTTDLLQSLQSMDHLLVRLVNGNTNCLCIQLYWKKKVGVCHYSMKYW